MPGLLDSLLHLLDYLKPLQVEIQYISLNLRNVTFVMFALYGIVLIYLITTHHATLKTVPTIIKACCIDRRTPSKYNIAGGVVPFTLGLIPYLLSRWLDMPWFLILTIYQFTMGGTDILLLYAQFLRRAWQWTDEEGSSHFGFELIWLQSHGLGCVRSSANDPIGLIIWITQIVVVDMLKQNQHKLAFQHMRDIATWIYTLVGFVPAFIICLPALALGKLVLPVPIPVYPPL